MEKIRINGSICLTELIEKAKAGHSAFSKAQNGKLYVNFTGWVNADNDNFKDFSLQLNSKQDKQEGEGKVYFGNGKIKPNQQQQGQPVKADEVEDLNDLPWDKF